MGAATEVLLDVTGLCVDYGLGDDAVHAVVDASFTLRRGEVLGLAGESGSGKSTLAYAVTRLLRPPGIITAGDATFRDTDMLAAGEHELRGLRWNDIAVVLQSSMHALNPVLSIGTQFADTLRAHRPAMSRAAIKERSAELLQLVGISESRLRSYPHELSGGMRQRVMIAMALALDPQVVILDEPTTALDVVTQRQILEELTGLRDRLGFAVLFISHDLSLLVEIADSIAVMYAGRIVEQAPAMPIYHEPAHPYSRGLLGSFPALHGEHRVLEGIPGSPPDLREALAGCAFRPRCPYAFMKCQTDTPPLLSIDGQRKAACWLHDGSQPVPAELTVTTAEERL